MPRCRRKAVDRMTAHEFALLHAFYVAILEKELGHPIPVLQSMGAALTPNDSAAPDHPLPESCGHLLAVLDLAVSPRMLRDYVLAQNPAEATLLEAPAMPRQGEGA